MEFDQSPWMSGWPSARRWPVHLPAATAGKDFSQRMLALAMLAALARRTPVARERRPRPMTASALRVLTLTLTLTARRLRVRVLTHR